ncbi:potassium transporter [Emticicia sp. CRIBPO]|uniref:monovalent cation:proton antiporter-2 (CPA2) family protein n=1 Tax=Emticicia sp. CRIBPO TaxID=2683258 RepID=UPI001412BACC|nr:monovalent cation:proton antiporter-2 (CPA2) family protein [Emticicia sp. CRIBPO]NBA85404.1 potassium transporter [Emticicia sp. CRIBPO]
MSTFLLQSVIFLGAAILIVPFIKKLGLSSILGYLLAGVIIGPFGMSLVGGNGQDIMHAAEFGVVMMLFLIGLELEPKAFWEMRKSIAGLGMSQMLFTTALLFGLLNFTDWSWQTSLAVALTFSMSSTAIVLQTLKEKNLSHSVSGQASFSVLLFQDIAVIPILALLPLLTEGQPESAKDQHHSFFADQPAWIQAISVVGAVGVILVVGRFLVVPFLRFVAKAGMRELLVAASLFLVIGVSALMQFVGLSPALGAFMAGVVLANSEFRHELESNLDPFKGLLLGLFFLSVGVTIDFAVIFMDPVTIVVMAVGVLIVKFGVLFMIGRFFKMSQDQNFLFSFGLSQVGEFGFVLISFCNQLDLIDTVINAKLMAVVAITMTITPLLMMLNEKLIDPFFGVKTKTDEEGEIAEFEQKHKIIIAGFGHFGSTIGRLLRANGIKATILDNNSDRVELLRNMGFKVYYGDATRAELLKAAGAEEASILIAAIDSPDINRQLIDMVRENFPKIKIFSRARNRFDAYDLLDLGVKNVYRETLYSAVHLGEDALVEMGFRKYTAHRQGQRFIKFDEDALERLGEKRHNMKEYVLSMKDEMEWQEQLLYNDLEQNLDLSDKSWDSDALKDNFQKTA